MKTLLAVLVSCIAAAALAAGMSEQAFTDVYAQQAKAAFADMEIKIVEPLHLQTKSKDGTVSTIFLTNAYTQYLSSPDDLQAIIGNHVAAMKLSAEPIDTKSSSSIFAVIKPVDYVTAVAAQGTKANIDREVSFVVETLNEDLRVLYILDTESSMQMLTKEGVKKTGLDESALRVVAVKNLAKYFSDKQARIEKLDAGKGTIYQVVVDGNYEASVLLLDDYWNKKNFAVDGDIIVFVPARNVVIVTGSEDQEGLRIASRVAQSGYEELGYAISPYGYRRDKNGWTRFVP